MAITIYWSMFAEEWLRSEKPVSIYKNLLSRKLPGILHCPATKDYYKNLYGIKSIYDYDFQVEENNISSGVYDQFFFDEHVQIRDVTKKFFSFRQPYVFFSEQNLEMTAGMFPFMEENEITNRLITLTGTFNISKWFRVIDFAFILKNDYTQFSIKENDIYNYIQFHTSENIIFKKFQPSQKLKDFATYTSKTNEGRKFAHRKMLDYYKYFTIKKQVIKEIKENLIDD